MAGEKTMRINLQLKDVVKNDRACNELGLSVWCVNEGTNGDAWIEMDLKQAEEWGLLYNNKW